MKNYSKPIDVDVRVNASCELTLKGERWGAGAEVRMPFDEAVEKAKQGIVTVLVSVKEITKEATHGSAG